MKIKLIATDLDGTLLNSDKAMSDYTASILQKCREAGIKTVYATGRGTSAEKLFPQELFDGKITMNGAVAKIGDTIIHRLTIPFEVARPLLTACASRGLKTASEAGGTHYANFDVKKAWPGLHGDCEIVDFATHTVDAEKLYIITDNPEDLAFIESRLPEDLYLTLNMGFFAMVMHKSATKAKAVAELAKIWSIDPSEIAAFGDDFNDIDMLEWAGVGVAMQNAIPETKAAANFVTNETNDNDGVARWLKENVL